MSKSAPAQGVNADHESVWKHTLFPYYEDLEAVLRCPICQEFMKTPASLSACGHHFCSLCISRWLESNHSDCPSCRKPQVVKSAQYSRSMDTIVSSFVKSRSEILKLTLKRSDVDVNLIQTKAASSPGSTLPSRVLQEDSNFKRMPKLSYSCLSDKQLKAKLKELDIPPDSSREVNEFMHKEYTLRYNAAYSGDKSKMPLATELRKQVLTAKRHKFNPKGKGILQFAKPGGNKTSPQNSSDKSNGMAKGFRELAKELHLKKKRDRELKEKQWRVVYSERCKKPFFFNLSTGIGQFDKPRELRHRHFDAESVKAVSRKKRRKKPAKAKTNPVAAKKPEETRSPEVVEVIVQDTEEKSQSEEDRSR